MGITTPEKIDPFTDRTARDIRNSLSASFVTAIAVMDPDRYLNVARKWREQNFSALYTDYIDDRLLRYDLVFNTIRAGGINDPMKQALVIWNQSLFFEFHDQLETLWQAASGNRRQALKGLIKAAAVYVHLEQHHQKAAESLALKSFGLLRKYADCLTFIGNYETLLHKLKKLDPVAPCLEILPEKNMNAELRHLSNDGKESAC
jgi:uncharacterized protein